MDKNQLVKQPVPKLFFHYLLPAVSGTMVTSIYILADTIIIGKGIGTEAMAALNIVLPVDQPGAGRREKGTAVFYHCLYP